MAEHMFNNNALTKMFHQLKHKAKEKQVRAMFDDAKLAHVAWLHEKRDEKQTYHCSKE